MAIGGYSINGYCGYSINDYYIRYTKILARMTSQKCQPRLGQKVHNLVTTDKFKMIYPK